MEQPWGEELASWQIRLISSESGQEEHGRLVCLALIPCQGTFTEP